MMTVQHIGKNRNKREIIPMRIHILFLCVFFFWRKMFCIIIRLMLVLAQHNNQFLRALPSLTFCKQTHQHNNVLMTLFVARL